MDENRAAGASSIRCPFAEHTPHHPRLPPQERVQLPFYLPTTEAILLQQTNRVANPVTELFARDEQRDQRFDAVPLPPAPVPRSVQPDIVCDALMVDLFGRMPAPNIGGNGVRPI